MENQGGWGGVGAIALAFRTMRMSFNVDFGLNSMLRDVMLGMLS